MTAFGTVRSLNLSDVMYMGQTMKNGFESMMAELDYIIDETRTYEIYYGCIQPLN